MTKKQFHSKQNFILKYKNNLTLMYMNDISTGNTKLQISPLCKIINM